MITLLCAGMAVAAPVSEEVVVVADPFARWDQTRWLLTGELWLPLGVKLGADVNHSFVSHALQVKLILACEKEARLGSKKWEVDCALEDVALLVTTKDRYRLEKDRALVDEVLQQVDAKLTGARVQLQVDSAGGVSNIDLEDIPQNNTWERDHTEALRQVLSRLLASFHLKLPADPSKAWAENHSELMDLPALTATRGSTVLMHQATRQGEVQVVQTAGKGTAALPIPNVSAEGFFIPMFTDPAVGTATSTMYGGLGRGATETSLALQGMSFNQQLVGLGGAILNKTPSFPPPNSIDPVQIGNNVGAELSIEVNFSLEAQAVAVFDQKQILSERVWVVNGAPTPSLGVTMAPFRNSGRLRMLGPDERPDVGPTQQVAWPQATMAGLPDWRPLE